MRERATHVRRLLSAGSAFCARDLISLAKAGAQPADLRPIYEWYSTRTMRAIATSYAVATAAGGGLLTSLQYGSFVPAGLLAIVVGLAALCGLFQHAELAQLPRELAESSRLLATLGELVEKRADLGTPMPRDDTHRWWWMVAGIVGLALLGVIGVVLVWGTKHPELDIGAVVIACAAIVILATRVWAEFSKPPDVPPRKDWDTDAERRKSLFERIGKYRLDQYVTDADVAGYVNHCIEWARDRLEGPMPRSLDVE